MRYIYADNFRGFTNTLMPLQDVNFLVGENSTGKTSMLALIKLLSSRRFWYEAISEEQFNIGGYEFGGFKDIYSGKGERSEKFCAGIIQQARTKKPAGKYWTGLFATFTSANGLAALTHVCQLTESRLVCIRLEPTNPGYIDEELKANFPANSPQKVFELLKGQYHRIDHKPMPNQVPIDAKMPLSIIFMMLQHTVTAKEPFDADHILGLSGLLDDYVWLAPIRTLPRRTYDGYGREYTPEGEHTPYELRRRLSEANEADFCSALNRFGEASGMFRKLSVHSFETGPAAPFELLVTLSESPLRINSVGYGVSQVLPVVVEMLARDRGAWFAIQQPEVHLHPRAQAALGDLVFDLALHQNKHFLIESHSDFMVDRFRLRMRREKTHSVNAQVMFFEKSAAGNKLSALPISMNGEYPIDQPKAFREFFVKEQLDILGL